MKVVLFADNDPDFLNTRAESLENAGYRVLKACTLEETRRRLREDRLHLAILDIRMEDDDDDRDVSGLALARDPEFRVIPKIILTGRSFDIERVREALRATPEGYPPAIDFIGKAEGPDVLIQAIERAFAQHVQINWDLSIRWGRQNELPSSYLVNSLAPDLPRERLADWSAELEDVVRKLFYGYEQVTLGRVLTRRPEGWILLTVFAYKPQEVVEEQFALACGQRDSIMADRAGHGALPQATRRALILVKSVETMHLGATAYRLAGCEELEEVTTLTRFYRQQSGEQVAASVKDLFQTTLRPLYARGVQKRDRPVEALCRERLESAGRALSPQTLEKRIEALIQATLNSGILQDLTRTPRHLDFRFPDGTRFSCLNPVPYLFGERLTTRPPTRCGTIHHRLDGASVLVDRSGQTWVVDFGKVGTGPLIWDFVSLEASVRFDMLEETRMTLRYDMERRLLAQRRLEDRTDTGGTSPEVEKALQVINEIRSQAAVVAGSEQEPYLMGLLFCALERFLDYQPEVRYPKKELLVFVHTFLLISMICQRLAMLEDRLQELPPQASQALWLDEANQEVWVEGHCVALPPQGFRLFRYLYERANQLCRREALAADVFDLDLSEYPPAVAMQMIRDTLNSAIRRLREDIEPDPEHPRYIQTVRGSGYKLVLPPHRSDQDD